MRSKILKIIICILCLYMMISIIIKPSTFIAEVQNVIHLCVTVIIPSLLPFCLFSNMLQASLYQSKRNALKFLEKVLKLPNGAGIVYILGILGGYPVGAMCVQKLIYDQKITPKQAQKLFAISNCCGPAFIFGVVAGVFHSSILAVIVWFILLLSSGITANIFVNESIQSLSYKKAFKFDLSEIISRTTKSMVQICAMILLVKLIILAAPFSVQSLTSSEQTAIIIGTIELLSGILECVNIQNIALRFVTVTTLLSLGGLSVFLQTLCVAPNINSSYYLKAKILQTAISFSLACLVSSIWDSYYLIVSLCSVLLLLIVRSLSFKKIVAFPIKLMYNKTKRSEVT